MPKIDISGSADIDNIRMQEQGSNPSTPAAGYSAVFMKSDGLYVIDDAGAVTGPLAVASSPAFVGARAYNSANLSINDDTSTALTLDSERYDSDAFHSTVSNTSRLTVPAGQAGKYTIKGNALYAANGTGIRWLRIRLNGTTLIASENKAGIAVTNLELIVATDYDLAAGDYVELIAHQTSGGALNVLVSGNISPEFMMAKL